MCPEQKTCHYQILVLTREETPDQNLENKKDQYISNDHTGLCNTLCERSMAIKPVMRLLSCRRRSRTSSLAGNAVSRK